jgi:head-tail adaptor
MKSINLKASRVSLQNPGPAVPDGDGGFTETWTPLDPPTVQAHVTPAATRSLEYLANSTVLAQATHLVTIWYHPQVTTQTQIVIDPTPMVPRTRTLNVLYVGDQNERHIELDLVCAEIVP